LIKLGGHFSPQLHGVVVRAIDGRNMDGFLLDSQANIAVQQLEYLRLLASLRVVHVIHRSWVY
jgi:hypothetical protein